MQTKPEGNGSSVNGGELLFLALATCFCNDIYREATKRKMQIKSVEVFLVDCDATEEEIKDLICYVDQVAEVHNTLRAGTPVTLKNRRKSGR